MRHHCGKRVQHGLQLVFESELRKLRAGNAKRLRVVYLLDDSLEGNLWVGQGLFPRVFGFEGINLAANARKSISGMSGAKGGRNCTIEGNQAFRVGRLNPFVFTQGNR